MERPGGEVGAGADRAAAVASNPRRTRRPRRRRCPRASHSAPDRVDVGRHAALVDDDDCPGRSGEHGLDRAALRLPVVRLDVGEDRAWRPT